MKENLPIWGLNAEPTKIMIKFHGHTSTKLVSCYCLHDLIFNMFINYCEYLAWKKKKTFLTFCAISPFKGGKKKKECAFVLSLDVHVSNFVKQTRTFQIL